MTSSECTANSLVIPLLPAGGSNRSLRVDVRGVPCRRCKAVQFLERLTLSYVRETLNAVDQRLQPQLNASYLTLGKFSSAGPPLRSPQQLPSSAPSLLCLLMSLASFLHAPRRDRKQPKVPVAS